MSGLATLCINILDILEVTIIDDSDTIVVTPGEWRMSVEMLETIYFKFLRKYVFKHGTIETSEKGLYSVK